MQKKVGVMSKVVEESVKNVEKLHKEIAVVHVLSK